MLTEDPQLVVVENPEQEKEPPKRRDIKEMLKGY
jgi:hypothetical protein